MDGDVRAAWTGLLKGRRPVEADVVMVLPLKQSTSGGSGAFLVRGDDGKRYWVKVINNPQGQLVPVIEQIVGRAGQLIGAATCYVKTIEVPLEILPWDFRPGTPLNAGIAHACLAIDNCTETHALANRFDDDNRRRHASFFALYDWCWGDDVQWLIEQHQDKAAHMRYHSHDHGFYLPPSGPTFTTDLLETHVHSPHELRHVDSVGIDPQEVNRLAEELNTLERSDIANVLAAIPRDWPAKDEELETVGWFLELRAPAVADRLRRRFGGV